jgi:hypothetical protein
MYAIVNVYGSLGARVAVVTTYAPLSLKALVSRFNAALHGCTMLVRYASVAESIVVNPVVLREWHMRSWLASHGGTYHPYRDQWRIL